MLNAFKRPLEKETLDAWAKIADDIAKISILALPVLLYGKEAIWFKIIHSVLLVIAAYAFILIARIMRKHKITLDKKEENNA